MNNAIVIYHSKDNTQTQKPIDYQHVIIWLHGLGADGSDFVPVVPHLGLTHAAKFIFPHAPQLPVTINGGYVMSAWYDILQMNDISRQVDIAQIEQSALRLLAIIRQEMAGGVPAQNIVIAGFSQGGAVVYHTLLRAIEHGIMLGGVLGLSTYFASEALFDGNIKTLTQVLICHGTQDPVVSYALGRQANDKLTSLGFSPIFKSYPMAHQVCDDELSDIGQWLNQVAKLNN